MWAKLKATFDEWSFKTATGKVVPGLAKLAASVYIAKMTAVTPYAKAIGITIDMNPDTVTNAFAGAIFAGAAYAWNWWKLHRKVNPKPAGAAPEAP